MNQGSAHSNMAGEGGGEGLVDEVTVKFVLTVDPLRPSSDVVPHHPFTSMDLFTGCISGCLHRKSVPGSKLKLKSIIYL